MQKTPLSNRTHIGIYGSRNAGKSTLFNTILGQNVSVVSTYAGTTTDPVIKAMELIPYGPVAWIDTAGLDDVGELGDLRVEKTKQMLLKTDFAIYLIDGQNPDFENFEETKNLFKLFNIPYLAIVNKKNAVVSNKMNKQLEKLQVISADNREDVISLLDSLQKSLNTLEEDPAIIGGLVPYNGTVVLVVPIDSEAPKGRLILPQVQLLRDCLDHGIKCHVVRDTELSHTLQELKKIDLVVTDSQAFSEVSILVPAHIPLTSFSILFARQKGNFNDFLEGVNGLKALNHKSSVLISESCTHNHSHEDIGRVKIPNLLRKHVSSDIQIDFSMGQDFPLDLTAYDLVVHCGACMVNRKTMINRIRQSKQQNVPMTNYGLLLAHFSGILERSVEIIRKSHV